MPWHLRAVIIIRGEEKRRAASISHRDEKNEQVRRRERVMTRERAGGAVSVARARANGTSG